MVLGENISSRRSTERSAEGWIWDDLDYSFLGVQKVAMLKVKEWDKDDYTLGLLVMEIEAALLEVLQLSPPMKAGKKHGVSRHKRKEDFWDNRAPIFILLSDYHDLASSHFSRICPGRSLIGLEFQNDKMKSSVDSDDIQRSHMMQKKLWDVMTQVHITTELLRD